MTANGVHIPRVMSADEMSEVEKLVACGRYEEAAERFGGRVTHAQEPRDLPPVTYFETHHAGTADLVARLRAGKNGQEIEAAARIEQLEAENKRLGDLYDDTCYYHTPDGRAKFHARKIVALEAELTRANAATAAAYEVAARVASFRHDENKILRATWATPSLTGLDDVSDEIRALATPDQIAALDRMIAEAVGTLVDALDAVLAWHDKDKHTAGKMTFERSSVFAKARAASKKGGV